LSFSFFVIGKCNISLKKEIIMNWKATGLIVVSWVAFAMSFPGITLADGSGAIYTEAGIVPNSETFSTKSDEVIDPLRGGLTLRYTDMSFPGNGGLDLNIIRTYNSKRTYLGAAIGPIFRGGPNNHSTLGYGWDITFGRMQYVYGDDGDSIEIEMPDATLNTALQVPGEPYLFRTRDQWLVNWNPTANTRTLTLPDGTIYSFNYHGNYEVHYWYATSISKNGNTIAINYFAGDVSCKATEAGLLCYDHAPDYIIDTLGRRINFAYTTVKTGIIGAGGNIYLRLKNISWPPEAS